ncbi:protein inturned isoform X2 [Venturia canescens]|uniref:protein inturned isoform X2 n=1 Tax=Venturia canescens TaxID=32260 RepID=UPI001C9C27EF|nr:protein inturned isoform X2 [Venturia canescens]
MNGSENKNLLKSQDRRVNQMANESCDRRDDDDNDWWASDSGSSTGSYYSDSESSAAEWESEISPTGEVFYIESLPKSGESEDKSLKNESESPVPELIRRRSTRAGKLMRLIRRRESKRYSTRGKKTKNISGGKHADGNQHKEGNGNKEVTFRDCQAGEIREVTLAIDPEKRHKLGRRATLCEAYLGISPGDFSDKIRVMVAGFIPDGEAMRNKNIKIGDWLRSINSRQVTSQNLEHILSEISSPTTVKLELQRVAGVEVTAEPSVNNFPKVRRLVDKEASRALMESLFEEPFGVIYLKTTGLSETGPELQGVVYTYPRSELKTGNNYLCKARGAFVTLNHMLPEITGSTPQTSTIFHAGQQVYVLYIPRGEELFLMALPESSYSLQEACMLSRGVVQTLEFCYQSLTKCFENEENHSSLDHFFNLFFTPSSNEIDCNDVVSKSANELSNFCKNNRCEFETIFPAAHFIKLPRDAQIQIDAALNEMEAMDYRDWNEDPMDCQRLYTILGSCLYHKSYLLASHLPHEDLIQVHLFLRQNRLLNLVENEATKLLVVWRRVYPLSCQKGVNNEPEMQSFEFEAKFYLLVVGFGHELLAVILECGGCTAETNDVEGPDIFYVEEAQETLKHIQKIGISTLANKWVLANARPETMDFNDRESVKTSSTIAENILGLIKSSEVQNSSPRASSGTVGRKKTQEVTSILKRRSPEQSPIMSGSVSVYSLQTSEDSMSQGTGAVSEMSDEAAPILGRRATRERNIGSSRHSDDSDSDVDMYRNDSQMSTMDISDIRENLLNQAEYIVPTKLTAGEKNCLLHYVHLDVLEGLLLSSRTIENPMKNEKIVKNFNRYAHAIHKLLDNTVRFKKIVNEDVDKTLMNKNLIAIKEHGVLFDFENTSYWVVGRLYAAPEPKEFYVCYEDSVPQNIVEMAFKLNASWN